ncbi:hypothetical protein CMI37_19085 [Candidatus Pacearchaeota archaeon]|nr:hypothetical protein [Candidatus Pacearchaeota archaeon]|tara:strand:+ start:126 stop:308 length:183 start_codon:yes stop_codon:yes gene_type:complete
MSFPCRELPGWTWYEWPNSVGGDNLYLQHEGGTVAQNLEEAREKEVLLRADEICAAGEKA